MVDIGYRVDYGVLNEGRGAGRRAAEMSPTPRDLFDPAIPPDVDELSFLRGYMDGIREVAGDRWAQI